MKAQIAAKYIQFLSNKKANKNSGFTLIELLVVIIIIGILSAIALPSFLNQAAKARGAEAKSNVGSMNRAQQAYFLEQQTFSPAVPDLGLSFPTTTENFTYGIATGSASATSVTNQGTSRKADIKSYGGRTQYDASTTTTQGTTTTILCEAKNPGTTAVAPTTTAIATGCGTDIVVK